MRDIADLIIKAMLKYSVLQEHELSHISFNPGSNRYENDELHVTLLNSSFTK